MAVDFRDYFWGEKNDGFHVLYQNMKCGAVAAKELTDYLRERAKLEDDNAKSQAKLAKQLANSGGCGTFAPLLMAFKVSAERLALVHNHWTVKLSDLAKEVAKYSEELHRKHKSVKDELSPTLESVKAVQETMAMVAKAKESFKQRSVETEKLQREAAAQKDVEKAEAKLKKAQEDYKSFVEKYSQARDEFEKRMTQSARQFQEVETEHLNQLRSFVEAYCLIVDSIMNQLGRVYQEHRIQMTDLTVDNLLGQFTLAKHTGLEKPGAIDLDEEKVSLASVNGPPSDTSDKSANTPDVSSLSGIANSFASPVAAASSSPAVPSPSPTPMQTSAVTTSTPSSGFLRKNRKKGKKKSNDEKEQEVVPVDDTSAERKEVVLVSDGEDCQKAEAPSVDEEGYSRRPTTDPWGDLSKNDTSFYSSSDESDNDNTRRKIKVEIKPITNGGAPISASVDELRSAAGALELVPAPTMARGRQTPQSETTGDSSVMKKQIQRSHSQSNLSKSTLSHDLLGLSLHPIEPTDPPPQEQVDTSTTNKEVQDILGISVISQPPQPALPPKQRPSSVQREMVSNSLIALPRPPSRLGQTGQRDKLSSTLKSSSVESSHSRTAPPGVWPSRCSSPATIGTSDGVPLAVAFQEVCHACFCGADESLVQVRLVGDLMISFPAGIVEGVSNSKNPAPLLFRIKHANTMESVVPNKQLISPAPSLSSANEMVFEFNMKSLRDLLQKQSEQSPGASYFNIDILKYQVRCKSGADSCPLQLVAYWKCESGHTDLRLDYKYNPHSMASPFPLLNLSVAVPVNGGMMNMQSQPMATWLKDSNRVLWKFPNVSHHDNGGIGSLRGRFQLSNGPGSQSTIATQFNCEGTTLSGVDFELVGSGYRLSLVKKRFVSGKYICDGSAAQADPGQHGDDALSSEGLE